MVSSLKKLAFVYSAIPVKPYPLPGTGGGHVGVGAVVFVGVKNLGNRDGSSQVEWFFHNRRIKTDRVGDKFGKFISDRRILMLLYAFDPLFVVEPNMDIVPDMCGDRSILNKMANLPQTL